MVELAGVTEPKKKSAEAVLERLKSSAEGLSQKEVEQRLKQYGYNELPEKKQRPILRFLGYLWGPIPWMIEAAALLSAIIRDWTDFVIIMALLLLNAVVGFWEEFQADNAVSALKEKLALQADAKRDGHWRLIPARELVPGDIIRLRLGDIVPADAVLLEGDPVEVDQSALTGESLPVTCGPDESVYSGSIIRQGEIAGVVSATGARSYFGKTASLVEGAHSESHFQRAVLKIGDYLIVLAVMLVMVILITSLFRRDSALTVLRFALVLTVAAIPVAMPTVLSVTMAVGSRLLSLKQAIVRRLAAIEELAGIQILCSDKTGTLTQNKLKMGDTITLEGYSKDDLLLAAALATEIDSQDPIDMTVLEGFGDKGKLKSYKIEHFQPFDPVNRRTVAIVADQTGAKFKVSKGAIQKILALAGEDEKSRPEVKKIIEDFAAKGFRALGVARTDARGGWHLLGVLALYDPPREDSRITIESANRLGVKVKMITGDQLAIARETGRQLGMGGNIISAASFNDLESHKFGKLENAIVEADGFAEVFPEQKYDIVNVIQKRGHIVGMTGDGVNDAPALKKADVGIAVSGATSAARAAADIVLTAPGLSVIVGAIKESRKIFQRMTSYAMYRIAETIRVLFFMTLSILVFNFYPVTAVMIVLLALLNDGAILSIAYDRVQGSLRPESWHMPRVLGIATVLGIAGVIESFGLFYLGDRLFHLNRELLQTLIYLKLSVAGHLTIFVTRTRGPFWSYRPSLILLGAVIITQVTATMISVYGLFMTPIGWSWALLVWGYCLVGFIIEDRIKLAAYKIFDKTHPGFLSKIKIESMQGAL